MAGEMALAEITRNRKKDEIVCEREYAREQGREHARG